MEVLGHCTAKLWYCTFRCNCQLFCCSCLKNDITFCELAIFGTKNQIFYLYFRCTPLFLHGQMTEEYYLLSDSELKLNCEDPNCENCRFDMSHFDQKSQDCWPLDSSSSLQVGRPLIYSWQRSSDQLVNYVANVFFSETYCAFYSRYIQPQVLSTHINLGMGNGSCANSIDFRVGNETWIQKAFWVSWQ